MNPNYLSDILQQDGRRKRDSSDDEEISQFQVSHECDATRRETLARFRGLMGN